MADLTCATCGQPMKRVAKSLPQGQARCHPCRRDDPAPRRTYSYPATKTMTCSVCGGSMWRSRTSLPVGQAVCLPCRRQSPKRPKPAHTPELRFCKICSAPFETKRPDHVYCSAACRNSRRSWSRAKPSSAERGYGAAHRRERLKWKPIVDAGGATCCLCGFGIDPGTPWHLDHTPDRTAYRGPAHASCNIRDGAKRGNQRSQVA